MELKQDSKEKYSTKKKLSDKIKIITVNGDILDYTKYDEESVFILVKNQIDECIIELYNIKTKKTHILVPDKDENYFSIYHIQDDDYLILTSLETSDCYKISTIKRIIEPSRSLPYVIFSE